MVQVTRAVVIHTFSYSDTSVILRAYSEEYGFTSFLLKGFKKNRKQKVLLHPLAVVEISCVAKNRSSLRITRNLELQNSYSDLLLDPVKSGIAMFLAEWLSHTLRDAEEGDSRFFNWLLLAIESLNESQLIANYHLWFILKMSDFMGFSPQGVRTNKKPHFNLKEGIFTARGSSNENLNDRESVLIDQIINSNLEEISSQSINKEDRAHLLRLFHNYFQLHLDREFTLKSIDVLTQLFDD